MLLWNVFVYITFIFTLEAHASKDLKRTIFEDALAVWQSYRDPENGVWCDTLRFTDTPMVTCGEHNNFYSSAGTGGLLYFYVTSYCTITLLLIYKASKSFDCYILPF